MKIAVICSNGKVGKMVVAEAQAAGLDVTGFARSENRSGVQSFVQKDVFALTAADLAGFDVVVDAFGAWTSDTVGQIAAAAEHLCHLLAGTKTRLVVVGGAGSLYVNKEHTMTVADSPDFPDMYKPVAAAHQKALDFLRTQNNVRWTYISPAADFQVDAPKTGTWIWAGEDFTLNGKGESIISYADYAAALVEEITKGNNIQKRISVVRA